MSTTTVFTSLIWSCYTFLQINLKGLMTSTFSEYGTLRKQEDDLEKTILFPVIKGYFYKVDKGNFEYINLISTDLMEKRYKE